MSTNLIIAAIYFTFTLVIYVLVMHYAYNFAWRSAVGTGLISSAMASLIFVFWFRKRAGNKKS